MLPDTASRRGPVPDLKMPEPDGYGGYSPLVAIQIAPAGKAADMIKLHYTESAPKTG